MAESYEPKKRGVKEFLGNKLLYFQQLAKIVNTSPKTPKSSAKACGKKLTSFN
jgi:hypothetical protein